MPELTSWDQTGIMSVLRISTFLYIFNDNKKIAHKNFRIKSLKIDIYRKKPIPNIDSAF